MAEKILKPYLVTLEYNAVVMAESPIDAYSVASREASEIVRDGEADVSTGYELTSVDQLTVHGWDGMCLPYGGDGKTRLKDIFAALDALPTRDTKTVDMFDAPGCA